MTISGEKLTGGAGLMKVLLGSAAALFAAGASTTTQAADAALKKAPPVQYVKVCDIYGAGFFQLPGTVFCAAFRGQLQVDTNFEAGKDAVYARQDSKKSENSYSVYVSLDDSNKHTEGEAGGNSLAGLAGVAVPGIALGGVEPIPGLFKLPEFVASFRYEADVPGTVSRQVVGNY